MSIDQEAVRKYECPECGKENLDEWELREHGVRHSIDPSAKLFPEYYVCEHSGKHNQDVYLKIVGQFGPAYMAYENKEGVDRCVPHELIRHDWKIVNPEGTPFPEYES
jgi:hypothetical protein